MIEKLQFELFGENLQSLDYLNKYTSEGNFFWNSIRLYLSLISVSILIFQ